MQKFKLKVLDFAYIYGTESNPENSIPAKLNVMERVNGPYGCTIPYTGQRWSNKMKLLFKVILIEELILIAFNDMTTSLNMSEVML